MTACDSRHKNENEMVVNIRNKTNQQKQQRDAESITY